MNDLQVPGSQASKLVRYLKRFTIEIETIKKYLKTGEVKIVKRKRVETEVQRGQGGVEKHTIPLQSMYDINLERQLVFKNKRKATPLKHIPELLPEDIENVKMRIFGAEFPEDTAVKDYQADSTFENRFSLLVHISVLEGTLAPADWMNLRGITKDFLIDRLKSLITVQDKDVSPLLLTLAFKYVFPEPVKIGKATQQNFYNFGTKREAVQEVKKQIEGMMDGITKDSGEEEQGRIRATVVGEREGKTQN